METKTIFKSLSITQLIELRKEIEVEILERAENKTNEFKDIAASNLISLIDGALSITNCAPTIKKLIDEKRLNTDGVKLLKGILSGKLKT